MFGEPPTTEQLLVRTFQTLSFFTAAHTAWPPLLPSHHFPGLLHTLSPFISTAVLTSSSPLFLVLRVIKPVHTGFTTIF